MKQIRNSLLIAILSSLLTLLIIRFVFKQPLSITQNEQSFIPSQLWPAFDKTAPYTINGPLWVGYDNIKKQWRYLKINYNEKPSELERGLIEPGDPAQWDSQLGDVGYFSCKLDELPSGTHINNKYNPSTMAAKYNIDDMMIRVGNFWVDKYESSLVKVENENQITYIDDPKYGGVDSSNKSKTATAFDITPNYIAVSQRRKASSGLSYFVAEQAAVNNGKHIIRNEQWQAAASGTRRTDANGMQSGGEDWKKINDEDVSRYGLVGCAGSLWEWTSSWGQYGEHYEGTATSWYDWPGPGSYSEWDGHFDTYGDDIVINMAGRAFTRQDSARYASGLPAALVRGGSWGDHNRAGIFAMIADGAPSYYGFEVGFRCVK